MHLDRHVARPGREHKLSSARALSRTAAEAPAPSPTGVPEIPRPSAAVARLLRAGVLSSHFVFPEDGPARLIERWSPPPVPDDVLLLEVDEHLDALERALAPADPGALLTRVLTLLSHYRSEPNPPAVETMLAEDWADDLGEFPMWAIAEAARWWRRNRRFRPQICEIRRLCEEAVGEMRTTRDRLRAITGQAKQDRNPIAARMAAVTRAALRRIPEGPAAR